MVCNRYCNMHRRYGYNGTAHYCIVQLASGSWSFVFQSLSSLRKPLLSFFKCPGLNAEFVNTQRCCRGVHLRCIRLVQVDDCSKTKSTHHTSVPDCLPTFFGPLLTRCKWLQCQHTRYEISRWRYLFTKHVTRWLIEAWTMWSMTSLRTFRKILRWLRDCSW